MPGEEREAIRDIMKENEDFSLISVNLKGVNTKYWNLKAPTVKWCVKPNVPECSFLKDKFDQI